MPRRSTHELAKKGVSADALHPFADTEKYIEFLERPDRAAWQKPDEVVRALHLSGSETLVDPAADVVFVCR